MLTFESPFYETEGVVIFRDHASADTFHYLAGPPRLTRDPNTHLPHFILLKYKHALDAAGNITPAMREQLGGGFLMFGVDCGLSDETKNKIISELETRLPPGATNVNLVPVLYHEGKVNVIALDKQTGVAGEDSQDEEKSKFVRGILGTAVPSLLQDQRAIFSIALTPDAVTLVEEAYQSDMSPIGVMYELDFYGLRPALGVKAKVNMKRVYEQLKVGLKLKVGSTSTDSGNEDEEAEDDTEVSPASSGSGQSSIAFNADISFQMEKLKESGAIQIEITRQQEGQSVDQMEQRAMEMIKETLLKEFFKPAMTSQPAPRSSSAANNLSSVAAAARRSMASSRDTNRGNAGTGANGTNVEIGFQLQYKKEEHLREAEFDFNVAAPEKRTHAPNGFFSALIGNTEKANHIRQIDLDDDFFKLVDVDISTTTSFNEFDLKKITVDLQYGGTIDSPRVVSGASFEADDLEDEHFQAFRDEDDLSYRYQVHYFFGQSDQVAAQQFQYDFPWQSTTSRALVIHPAQDVSMLRVYVQPGIVDWDLVDQIETKLSYDDEANNFHTSRTLLVKQDSPVQTWTVRLTDPAKKEYQVEYIYHLKNHSEIAVEAETLNENQLFVGDPYKDRLEITMSPIVDHTKILRIDVEIEYEDRSNDHHVKKLVELNGPDFRKTKVNIPIYKPNKREYSYTVTIIRKDGTSSIQTTKETDAASINITDGKVLFDLDVRLLGNMTTHQIIGIQVDLRSEPPDGEVQSLESHFFDPDSEKRATVRLTLRVDRPQEFEYRITTFMLDGTMKEGEWTKSTRSILPIPVAGLV